MPSVQPFTIRQLTCGDGAAMEALMTLFGQAFDEMEKYTGARPPRSYFEALLARAEFAPADVDRVFYVIYYITFFVFLLVTFLLVYFVIKYRAKPGHPRRAIRRSPARSTATDRARIF